MSLIGPFIPSQPSQEQGQETEPKRKYVLGRECVLTIDGIEIKGASDVLVREIVTEVDATGFNSDVVSSSVTQWTWEISVSIPDIELARWLHSNRFVRVLSQTEKTYLLPRVFEVSLSGGLVEFEEQTFTINGVDSDEPLDGIVIPRFTFKEWQEDTFDSEDDPFKTDPLISPTEPTDDDPPADPPADPP